MKFVSASALTLGLAALAFPSANASNYPPNYPISISCVNDGPVKVCPINKDNNVPRFLVEYRGYLLTDENQADKISVWAKLNSRDGTFKLAHNPGSGSQDYPAFEYKSIGDITNVTCCWNYNPVPEDEKKLFFYAFDQNGRSNAWDIELAFFAENGKWDSKYGQNYKFRV